MIRTITPILINPRLLNHRLWELERKPNRTPAENRELDALCDAIETEQDNEQ